MSTLIEKEALRNRIRVFANRSEAGGQLAAMLRDTVSPDALVLAIPSGGVPVGLAVAEPLALDFDLLLVRKVKIPWNTEGRFWVSQYGRGPVYERTSFIHAESLQLPDRTSGPNNHGYH
jgi:predicted phosphoribosyltransferase